MTDSRRDTFTITATDKKTGPSDKVKNEVERLIKKGFSHSDLAELRNKYKDDDTIVEEVYKHINKKMSKVKKEAKELAEKIFKKYSDGRTPYHVILEKMMRYKTDNKWGDYEYDEFRKELAHLLSGSKSHELSTYDPIMYRSRISQVLGYRGEVKDTGLFIKDSEQSILADILTMYERNMILHKNVFMNSILYEEFGIAAMTGEYKRDKHIASNHIHPLFACLYLHKFSLLEIQTLYANFGSIVKVRNEKKPIINEPDAVLYSAIISDPNDIACETNSPITDLRNRYRVQVQLWDTVLKLRQGNYYEAGSTSEFMNALNACKHNFYDNTDLVYNQDEGSILRRFMSVWSLRPTMISTRPITAIASFGMQQQHTGLGLSGSMMPFNNQPVYTVTRIPMIVVQIPFQNSNKSARDENIDLRQSLNQPIWINEHKTLVPKEQSVIHSNELLIFYVNRRVQRIQIKSYTNPLCFSQLPMTVTGFEKLNTYPVGVPEHISVGSSDETFSLASVVAVTETEIVQGTTVDHIITGCVGLLTQQRNFNKGIIDTTSYIYDPYGASIIHKDPAGQPYVNKPISIIPSYIAAAPSSGYGSFSLMERASTHGTIFIYAKPGGYNTGKNELIFLN